MKGFSSTVFLLGSVSVTACLVSDSQSLFAANDDEYHGDYEYNDNHAADEQKAISLYNRGLAQLNKAWEQTQVAKCTSTPTIKSRAWKKSNKLYIRAAESFQQAINYKPEFYQAYSSLGYIHRKTGALHDSVDAYNRALAIKPDYFPAIAYQAITHLYLREFAKVKEAFQILSLKQVQYAHKLQQTITEWIDDLVNVNTDDSVFMSFYDWFRSLGCIRY